MPRRSVAITGEKPLRQTRLLVPRPVSPASLIEKGSIVSSLPIFGLEITKAVYLRYISRNINKRFFMSNFNIKRRDRILGVQGLASSIHFQLKDKIREVFTVYPIL